MKKALTVFLVILFMAAIGHAAEKSGWWTDLKGKVDKLTAPKSQTTTAVGGVRGAKEESETVYWKGKEKVSKEELDAFGSALNLALEGKAKEAEKGFKSFLDKYPKSALAEDARKSLQELTK